MMILKYFGFLVLFALALFTQGQTQEIDSLIKVLVNQQLDSNKVNTLRRLGISYRKVNKDSSLLLLNQSIDNADKIGFELGISRGLYAKALTYGMTGDYAEALVTLSECEAAASKIGDYKNIVYSNNARGIIYKRLGDYPASKSYYLKNIKLADSLNLGVNMSSVYTNLGILYDLMDEKEKALQAYRTAIEVHKGSDLKELKRTIETNIAVMEYSDGNFETALSLFLNSIPKNNKIGLANSYSNIGICYMRLGNWPDAEKYMNMCLGIAKELDLKKEEIVVLRNKSELMLEQGRLEEAESYYEAALKKLSGYGQYQWKKDVHDLAFQINERKGELGKAIEHLKKAIIYKDSLFNETKMREIKNMELQHNIFVKNQEIARQALELALLNERVELENRRKMLLGIIALLSIFSVGLLIYGYQRKQRSNNLLKQKNQLIVEQKAQIQEMNTELEKKMLRAQMNPHFIFNSLNSIQHFIATNDKTSALTYLTKFSKLLRQVLESSIDLNVILEDEIKLLKIYVELEALRFDETFTYEFKIDKSIDTYSHEIPILLVQPYIENAIIHGLIPKNGKKHLLITFEDSKEYIKCIIQDNGIGRKESDSNGEHISRGMLVTEQRIQSLEKTNFQMVIIEDLKDNDQPTGTRVTVAIPKND